MDKKHDYCDSLEDDMAGWDTLNGRTHNFGIYTKKGKRAILQIDFPGKAIFLIQRGHIKMTYSFMQLQHFDSEEGVHLVLKFKEQEFEFDADNMEEKYTLCRLISYVLEQDAEEDGISTPKSVSEPLPPEVMKEGVVEKKGNTTITTWNKRRLKVTPGEFSYYKTSEEHALNVVQIWEDICVVKRAGQNGFTVTVRNRVYSFRLINDRSHNVEVEREEWIEAFHMALRSKRNTFVFFNDPSYQPISSDIPSPLVDDIPRSDEVSPVFTDDPAEEATEPQVSTRKQEVTKRSSLHLSSVEKTPRLEQLPTSKRPRPPAFNRQDAVASSKASLENEDPESSLETIEENDSGNVSSIRKKFDEKVDKLTPQKTDVSEAPREKPTDTMVVTIDFSHEPEADYPLEEELTSAKRMNDDHCERRQNRKSPTPRSPAEESSSPPYSPVEQRNITDDEKYRHRPLPVAPKSKPPVPVPSKVPISSSTPPSSPPPPLPAPPLNSCIPPPPPLRGNKFIPKVVPSVKMKQVYWSAVTQPVSSTMWENMHDVTSCLNLKALEEAFAAQEVIYGNAFVQGSMKKNAKAIVLDAKRAQNLGIMFGGPKPNTADKLKDALNSITETEDFPLDKLNTLRRYQPTADDIELFRTYKKTKHEQHPVDQFMIELCDFQALDIRLDLIITILDIPTQSRELSEEVNDLLLACSDLKNNTSLETVMEYILAIGNFMNAKTGRGARGFQITSIDKVLDVKGRSFQYTLLDYLIEQISLINPHLLDWPSRVKHVQKCSGVSTKAVRAEVEVLKNGVKKVKRNLKSLRNTLSSPSKQEKKFMKDVQDFIIKYEKEVQTLDTNCTELDKRYAHVVKYYGEAQGRTSDLLFSSVAQFAERFQNAREKRQT